MGSPKDFGVDVVFTPKTKVDKAITIFRFVTAFTMTAYTLLAAWEMLKILCPPLKVHQDILMAKLTAVKSKGRVPSRDELEAIVSEVTAYVREQEEK